MLLSCYPFVTSMLLTNGVLRGYEGGTKAIEKTPKNSRFWRVFGVSQRVLKVVGKYHPDNYGDDGTMFKIVDEYAKKLRSELR